MAVRKEQLHPSWVNRAGSPGQAVEAAGAQAVVVELPVGGLGRDRAAAGRFIRRRVVAAAVVGASIVGLVAVGAPESTVVSRPGAPASVTVQPGQTLWDLAERYAPIGTDPRAWSDRVARLNHLQQGPLSGSKLRLP